MIIRKEELIQYATDVELIEACTIEKPQVLVKMSAKEFISFCTNKGVQIVYYMYQYYDLDNLPVSDITIESYAFNHKERAYIKKWADEYNARIQELDPSRPFSLTLFCSLDHVTIAIEETDYWFVGDTTSGTDALVNFIEEHENEIDDLIADDYDDHTELQEEFENTLLSDQAFRLSTTISSRKQYVREFLSKRSNEKYLALARRAKWRWEQESQLLDIANRIYQEYRFKCRDLKLHPGDPLPE